MDIKLFDFLADNNINVYFPGQAKGECKSKYVVIKNDGLISENGHVGRGLIDIIFYTPTDNYLAMREFKKSVCKLIKEFKRLRYTGNETEIVIDDDFKAYTSSITYEYYKKMEG